MIQEKRFAAPSGWLVLAVLVIALALCITLFIVDLVADGVLSPGGLASILLDAIIVFLFAGLFVVNPNDARVLLLFGSYVGTARDPGLRWANPLYAFSGRRRVSLRVRNFETAQSKVNDIDGNPIEIAAVVVWKVVDTAEAVFEVNHFIDYVNVQSESAVRNLATRYPYDAHEDQQVSLRGNTEEIAAELKTEIQGRVARAGVEVLEARITHLAYAPEIAAAMLQRQQAGAIIAARSRIVEGAVSMVQMALDSLSDRNIVDLDDERKAAMVSNLLVVLCGDKPTQPVVNTGTLHQ